MACLRTTLFLFLFAKNINVGMCCTLSIFDLDDWSLDVKKATYIYTFWCILFLGYGIFNRYEQVMLFYVYDIHSAIITQTFYVLRCFDGDPFL